MVERSPAEETVMGKNGGKASALHKGVIGAVAAGAVLRGEGRRSDSEEPGEGIEGGVMAGVGSGR